MSDPTGYGVVRSVRLNGGDELPCCPDHIIETDTVAHDRGGNGVESPHLLVWYLEPYIHGRGVTADE